MKKYGLSLITIILLLSSLSCDDVYEMEETIFVPDENNKNLPAYTEWGYNSFGAMYERMYFFATKTIVPCKILYQNGIMTFTLTGRIGSNHSSGSSGEEMTLYFSFPVDEAVNSYKDLMMLHQKRINFTDSSCNVKMVRKSVDEDITVLSGSNLFFKRVQLLRINDKENRAILSGTFELTFLRNQLPEVLSYGRFDVGITHLFILP